MLKKLLFLLIFNFSVLNATEMPLLTFQKLLGLENHLDKDASIKHLKNNLKGYDQRLVEMRGFLFKSPSNEWILSSEPQLKSCCIGRSDKILKQIFLEGMGEIENSSLKVVHLQGYFKVNPKWDEQGNLIQLYSIEKVIFIKEKEIDRVQWILFAMLIGISFLLVYYIPKMKIPEKKDA